MQQAADSFTMMSPLANFSDVAGLDVPAGRLFANSAQVNTACTRAWHSSLMRKMPLEL